MIYTDYIVEVLGRFEGKAVAKGYIPCRQGNYYGIGPIPGDPLGASGVTIGTGFDLGQQNREALDKLNLPGPLAATLIPFLGAKKEAAIKKLGELPFTLTAEEVSVLDKAVHDKYIMETVSLFGQDRFEEAPKQAQAVAVSLHYQFGTPRSISSPSLEHAWNALRSGNYKEAAEYLVYSPGWRPDHRLYLPRRKQEAALLLEIA